MPSRERNAGRAVFSILLFVGTGQSLLAADLSTLFTTPQERQIINSNRYKSDKPKLVEIVEPVEETIELPIQPLVQEEVVQQYVISGITLSRDGPHSVWINSIMYEDGDRLDDNSRVKVLAGDEVRVRITAPDGKQYYATSGQALEVSYMVDVEN
jgi:hypothetical protein